MKADFWDDKRNGMANTINPDTFKNIPAIFDYAFKKFACNKAVSNLYAHMSFAQLDQASANFAAYLQHKTTLNPGDRIAVQLPNIIQYYVAVIGALRAGLVVVNTNPLYTEREMEHQFNDADIKALVFTDLTAHLVQTVLPKVKIDYLFLTKLGDFQPLPIKWFMQVVLKYVQKKIPDYSLSQSLSLMNCLQQGSNYTYNAVDASPSDIALLQYTGGTTGVAKGVMLTHRNLVANILQTREVVRGELKDEQEIIISPLPLYHVYSFTVSFMLMLYSGNHTVLITNPRDLPGFIKELKKYPFSVFVGLNTLFLGLCELAEFKTVNFSKLKITLSGGMALQRSVADMWANITGCVIREGYGLSETSPVVSFNPREGNQAGTIGLPVASTALKVIDDDGRELAIGEPGELCVQGPQVMPGYWRRDDETQKVLDGEGWLKTGDIAIIQQDGFVKIVDRKKDMIVVSGFKVFPNEIEDVMMHHPGIKLCAAIGIPDPHSGEVIKLFIVRKDKNLTEKDVLDYCHDQFTGYKRPKHVEFRDSLPMSNVGKILRKELRASA